MYWRTHLKSCAKKCYKAILDNYLRLTFDMREFRAILKHAARWQLGSRRFEIHKALFRWVLWHKSRLPTGQKVWQSWQELQNAKGTRGAPFHPLVNGDGRPATS